MIRETEAPGSNLGPRPVRFESIACITTKSVLIGAEIFVRRHPAASHLRRRVAASSVMCASVACSAVINAFRSPPDDLFEPHTS